MEKLSFSICFGRGTKARTLDTRFWRPLLYQLSYTPITFNIISRFTRLVKGVYKKSANSLCVVNRYDPKRPEKIKDMVLQRICAAGVEP